jgi:hypothetical protein
MSLKISVLKSKWNKEKKFYRTQEVGSGVQIFVKDVLKSEEIFNLKVGFGSTPAERRRNEFVEEKKTRESRRPDIIIYVSPDITIPVEVEKYQNIEAGIEQLRQYQADIDKKYGLLTDGYTWRFYNNNVFRKFTLDQILDETEEFLEFWTEYTKPEFYYLSFFESPGQLTLLKEIEKLLVEDNRLIFFEDITKLIRGFKNKLKIEGYFEGLEKKEREKKAVEITYAYIIQFILYKTLVDNDFDDFGNEYTQNVREIHSYIKAGRYKNILGVINGISAKISKNIYRPFAKEQEFINQKLLELYQSLENKLSDVAPWLDIFVFIKKYSFANVKNEIFGYIYENYLKELYEDEKKGQYFTDPAVVNFMLHQIGYTPENIKAKLKNDKESISLMDPACGSGTFLYSATDSIIHSFGSKPEEFSKDIEELVMNNIFGLDIAEFPLYLAEMNILMRMLPLIITEKYNNPIDKKIKVFLTKDSVAEFKDAGIENTINDIDVRRRQLSFLTGKLDLGYKSYVRDEGDLSEMKQSMRPPRRRFDFVIGNPPYVGYNECSKQGVLIFELMKQGKAKLNDIYGVNLHSVPDNPKKYRPNPNLYAFFVAVGLALLKDNGRLCYIIPQTILVAGDLDVLRYHLAKFTTIEKIIIFSRKMFTGRGIKQSKPIPTSSLIFVVSRMVPSSLHQVEVINYKNPEDSIEETLQNILSGKRISKKRIQQAKFLQNIGSWNFIRYDQQFIDFYQEYKKNTDDIFIYYNHIWADQHFESRFYFDGGYSIDERKLLKRAETKGLHYGLPRLEKKYWTIKSFVGYWPNIREKQAKMYIALRQGNQGYNFLDSKYKVIWSYNNTDNFFYTDLPIIWARNKILGIGSNNKNEILYLFALLNSMVTKNILHHIVKIEHEDTRTILVSLQIVKDQIRVPKINENNQHVKDEIIKRTKEMLELEEKTLSDFVDFSKVLIQKFKNIIVEGSYLVLIDGDKKTKLKIKGDSALVENALAEQLGKSELPLERQKMKLSDLRYLPVIDHQRQTQLKKYIDDLVFALYFKVNLQEIGFEKAKSIEEMCERNKSYKIIQTS